MPKTGKTTGIIVNIDVLPIGSQQGDNEPY